MSRAVTLLPVLLSLLTLSVPATRAVAAAPEPDAPVATNRAAQIDRWRVHADAGRDEQALQSLLIYARQGDSRAARAAGSVLSRRTERTVALDGLRWLERAAVAGDVEAAVELGRVFLFGRPAIEVDLPKAKAWFERANPTANGIAAYYLGVIAMRRSDDASAVKTALTHFEIAANLGVSDAMYRLGNVYALGVGAEPNPQLAMRWYLRAAASEHPLAIQEIAQAYARGDTLLPQSDFQSSVMREAMSHALRHAKSLP